MDMWVDERRRDHECARLPRLERADDTVGDGDAQALVDALRGGHDAALEAERVAAPVAAGEYQWPPSPETEHSGGAHIRESGPEATR